MKNILLSICAFILFVIITAYLLFELSKLRTYQLFGTLIPRVETQEQIIALTFDDGPTEHTLDVLEMLKEASVSATFYVIGSEIEKKPEIAKQIVSEGHELGNHSYSHPRFYLKSQKEINQEIQTTNRLIREAGYSGEITFRPPYGKKLIGLPWYLQQHKIKTITWDVEPDTYSMELDGEAEQTSFLINYTLEHTKNGSIIILHPFCDLACKPARNALPEIIFRLKEQGYTFVTISELLSK